jgi:hypothetical protein
VRRPYAELSNYIVLATNVPTMRREVAHDIAT